MTDPARAKRLAETTTARLKSLIIEMRSATDTSKAYFTLPELLDEEHRRKKVGVFPTVATAQKIVELVQASDNGLTTYLDIWKAFRPGEPWKGQGCGKEVANALDRVGFYCTRHGLPHLETLVVNSTLGELTTEAKDNIYNAARERGLNPGSDRDAYIADQQERARSVASASLPSDD